MEDNKGDSRIVKGNEEFEHPMIVGKFINKESNKIQRF